jgi:hypothetical protein
MNVAQTKFWAVSLLTILLLVSAARAQSVQSAHARSIQSVTNSLASLPEADTIIYSSPQRILAEAAPKVVPPADLAKMRATFADFKKTVGIDPGSIDYVAIAVRFQKPASDLSFVPPDLLAVFGGDFSADSMITLAGLYLQDRARNEKYGSKTLTIMKIDPIAEEAAKNSLLKPYVEMGVVALNANTLAVGNINYLKAAVDASEGNGRISTAALSSLLRDPNALVSAAGSPLTAFAKSFGLLGTQTTPRDYQCASRFGDFYAAITMDGTNFNLRGAMNTDNPDTAKIINGLISGLLQQAISSVPNKDAQTVLKNVKMLARENEVVWEADVPEQTVAALIREEMKPKPVVATPAKPAAKPRRRVRRK